MNLKQFKGKKVYLIGTGTNKGKWAGGYVIAAIKKVGRANVTLSIWGRAPKKFRFCENIIEEGVNKGYRAYETEQEAKDVLESKWLISLIVAAAQPNHLEKLSVLQLRDIAKAVGT